LEVLSREGEDPRGKRGENERKCFCFKWRRTWAKSTCCGKKIRIDGGGITEKAKNESM